MTPESETSCHYFWSVGRNYKIDNDQITAAMDSEFSRIFGEDVEIVEAQQKSLEKAPRWQPIDVNSDAPVLQARKLLNTLIAEEAHK